MIMGVTAAVPAGIDKAGNGGKLFSYGIVGLLDKCWNIEVGLQLVCECRNREHAHRFGAFPEIGVFFPIRAVGIVYLRLQFVEHFRIIIFPENGALGGGAAYAGFVQQVCLLLTHVIYQNIYCFCRQINLAQTSNISVCFTINESVLHCRNGKPVSGYQYLSFSCGQVDAKNLGIGGEIGAYTIGED